MFETVQRAESNNGEHWADLSVNRGSAIGYDWYAVVIGKSHPGWTDTLLRRVSEEVCILQGQGKISVSWAGPRELQVNCTECSQKDFHIYKRDWDGVNIVFKFQD